MRSASAMTRSVFSPRIFRISASAYPRWSRPSVSRGNLDASSRPAGMNAPSKSEPMPTWSAPAMLTVGGVSAGLQVGGSSSDFVLLVMTEKAVNTILDQKTKLGSDATAAAGPSGATAGSPVGGDVLTYGRAKGLFAGVSLGGASLEADNDANKRTYGKPISVRDIVQGNAVKTQTGQQELITLLDNKAGKHRD